MTAKNLKILTAGNYAPDKQESMQRFVREDDEKRQGRIASGLLNAERFATPTRIDDDLQLYYDAIQKHSHRRRASQHGSEAGNQCVKL